MDRLPPNIMFDIFSRLPGTCLACSRCVSKLWCEYIDDPYLMTVYNERVIQEPIPILFHSTHLSRRRSTHSLCFHVVVESKQTDHSYVLERKEGPFLEYVRKKHLSKSSIVRIEFRGSCNGLMCLSQDEDYIVTSLVVVHPLKKECYELPPLPMRFNSYMFRESCGLGFDASTNTLKMVCVRENLCTIVHVFGTNSWREIPQVPSYQITGKAIFANGCLHWLVSHIDIKTNERPIICFDVDKEEFGLIDPPKGTHDSWRAYIYTEDHLVDLNGEVGYFCYETKEVWVLKQKHWLPHCRFTWWYPNGGIEVLGCWNKDGDMLIRSGGHGENYRFCIYNLKSNTLHDTNIDAPYNGHPSIFMHPNKLCSIHGIGTNSFPMKEPDFLKESCRRLLTYN